MIRLGGCPGWSEFSLCAQPHCWFCHEAQVFFFWGIDPNKRYIEKGDIISLVGSPKDIHWGPVQSRSREFEPMHRHIWSHIFCRDLVIHVIKVLQPFSSYCRFKQGSLNLWQMDAKETEVLWMQMLHPISSQQPKRAKIHNTVISKLLLCSHDEKYSDTCKWKYTFTLGQTQVYIYTHANFLMYSRSHAHFYICA